MTQSQTLSVAMQSIKKQFMAYRNGIISDTLRQAGMNCYSVIFGLNIPQIAHIASNIEKDNSLADELWRDNKVRESRLLATYIFNPETLSHEQAETIINQVQTREEVDLLCFRLLRSLPYAAQLLRDLRCLNNPTLLQEYVAKMLARNLE